MGVEAAGLATRGGVDGPTEYFVHGVYNVH